MLMRIHALTVAAALESLGSRATGLSAAEAARRLQEYGRNRLERARREPLALRLAREFTHFFAIILWIAAALAVFAEAYQPGQGMAALGAAIVGVILVNGVFSFLQEHRAQRALSALLSLLPAQAKVLRDSVVVQLPAEELVPGDVVLLDAGDDVPADCRLIEAQDMRVNAATITGESVAVDKREHPEADADPLNARNLLLAGTALVSGSGKALVFATGMRTEFGRIARLTQEEPARFSPLQQEIRRLSRLVAALATLLGAVFFIIGVARGAPLWDTVLFAIGIIVANVPEGLLPTVTLSLAMATQRMARRNVLIRHLPAVEALGSATVICTDKTGTLTRNVMRVRRVFFAEGEFDADALPAAEIAASTRFFETALLCHDLKQVQVNGESRLLGDPMETALLEMGHRACPQGAVSQRLGEISFDADRKRLTTLEQLPQGAVVFCKGALETLLPLCRRVQTLNGIQPLIGERREQFIEAEDVLAERGMRVLAFAWREVDPACPRERWEEDLVLAGLVALEDPPRPEVPAAIRTCREAGIRVIMVTGDHPQTALAVAREVGIIESDAVRLIRGAELARMSDEQLQLALDAAEVLFARVAADQKLRIVQALQRKGHVVAATGDGVNDAPALKRADIGVAMGIAGTDVAREAADMVLLDDNFASIVAAIEEGRGVYDNLRKFLTYILTSNIPELVPYIAFVLFKIPLPLTIIQILAVDLGTDLLPALALGAERPRADVMRRPPRSPAQRLLDLRLLARAYLWLGPLQAVTAMAAFFYVLGAGGWHYGELLGKLDPLYLQATTACLVAIVVSQIVNVFLCRDPRQSLAHTGVQGNPLILWGIAVELALILAIVYTPAGNAIFGTAPVAAAVWGLVLPFACAMLLLEEGRKLVVRRWM